MFRYFLERSRYKLSDAEICELCPLHERLLEAPLVHLMNLVGYEMYTHLQSLTGTHPAVRDPITNDVLKLLYPWQQKRFCEPGTKVQGCLACELGRFYQDFRAMEALSVVAKSGRRGTDGIVQLVDEGWVGTWGKVSWGVREVRADRRKAKKYSGEVSLEWRGGKARVEWKEKKGFVLSHGREKRDSGYGGSPAPSVRSNGTERSGQSKWNSVLPNRSSRVDKPAPALSRGHSVRVDKPANTPPPVRPDRPKGLTLTMYDKEEDDRTIRRKPVPIDERKDREREDRETKDREKKTLSTATTIVGSPQIGSPPTRRPSVKHHRQRDPSLASPSSKATDTEPTTQGSRAPIEDRPVRPPSSMYSRPQGLRPPKHILRSKTVKPRNATKAGTREQEQPTDRRIPSTQQTQWSDFNRSNIPATSNARPPSKSHRDTNNPPSTPRRTKTHHAISKKIAAGEYKWWETEYSESEDEKVVVPSRSRLSRHNLRDSINSNPNPNRNSKNHHPINKVEEENEASDVSNSDYEGDENEEEIRQRYLDEHEALLRMAQGVNEEKAPRTIDYLNTLPERPMENTTAGMSMRMGSRGHAAKSRRPAEESTMRRGRWDRVTSSPWL
ncbi:MAG: hypothetical protein Q9221_004765 [Calogaya cf. arnoldii]